MVQALRNRVSHRWWLVIETCFAAIVTLVLAIILNTFIFRTYSVVGPSMNPTLVTGDQLFVNKIGVTLANITGHEFIPSRGAIVVFRNPLFDQGKNEEFVVKRVIGLPGERVVVREGQITIYTSEYPGGFNPDQGIDGPKQPTSGNVDRIVPEDELFVAGDNRESQQSFDSRNGLSTIPLSAIEGVAVGRIFPLNNWRSL